jgi:hypothetical protein
MRMPLMKASMWSMWGGREDRMVREEFTRLPRARQVKMSEAMKKMVPICLSQFSVAGTEYLRLSNL